MSNELTFWDHLDELRGCLWRIVIATVASAIVAFCLKEPLFDLILAPCHSDFILYRLLGAEPFSLHLINTGLAEHKGINMRRRNLRLTIYYLRIVQVHISCTLLQRATLFHTSNNGGLHHVLRRHCGQLFSHLPSHRPLPRTLSGKSGDRQHAHDKFIHRHHDDALHIIRHHLRDTSNIVVACPIRTSQVNMDVELSPTSNSSYTRYRSHHHTDDRHLHTLRRSTPDMAAV